MERIKGKKILFITPRFLKYEEYIKEKMENLGAKVYMFYENMKDINFLKKNLIKIIVFYGYQTYLVIVEHFHRLLKRVVLTIS